MNRREVDGKIYITFDAEDMRHLSTGGSFDLIPPPGPGKRIVVDELPELTFHDRGIDLGTVVYHIEEETA